MVDASSIADSITYMHGEEDVTANASDYFTITEDYDRRIIAPKDDTDYTITIAGGIEHGTITGAATAKYWEKVTMTATPDFGYRLVKLTVKDSENNDVPSVGSSFFMPKGNVTVSAEFEQGTHGTTEFVWGYDERDGFVKEATIYDGVTTVNLQQGMSYNILTDMDSQTAFLLDNDTYQADIPYSDGTGAFLNIIGTNFNFNGEAGFYDITMTDIGNGKWNVSILATVPQIDEIPAQTYTGGEITPEPLVLAGSLSLTKGTDYEYSCEDNINSGTAKVIVTFKGNYASLGTAEKTFTINPAAVFNAKGHGTAPYVQPLSIGDKVSRPDDLTAEGYTFGGWFTDSECTNAYDFDTAITGGLTLYAKWTPITYTITYNLDGGTADNPTSYTIESDSFTLSNPTKDGFTFAGWTETENDEPRITVTIQQGSTGNLEFTAAWTKNGFSPKDSSTPEFVYHSLILSGQIGVIFHVYAPEGLESKDCSIYFDVSGDKSQNTQPVYAFEEITENGYTLYGFTCYINLVQMADKIHAVFTYGDNQTITQEYTAKQYLSVLTGDETQSADTIALAEAIMDYGSYVQPVLASYNGWEIGKHHAAMTPANDYDDTDFTATETATQQYAITNMRGDSSGVNDVKFALILDSETTIELYLTPKDDYTGDVTACLDGGNINMAVKNGGQYTVSIGNISAHKLGETHTLNITTQYPDADSYSFTVKISALSYVQSAIHDDDVKMKRAVTSLYRYYDSTMTYRSNRPNIYGTN